MRLPSSPNTDSRDCRNCGSHVSQSFRRTFGDTEGDVHRCLACDTRARIQLGSATGPDVDWPDPAHYPERNRGPEIDQTVRTGGGMNR
jgi:hypothetical protein